MRWNKADQSKPKQGDKVLLKILHENCPVVGYWGEGVFEACCVNHIATDAGAVVEGDFYSNEVTHWAEIENLPMDE